MKKIFAMALSLLLAAGMLAGCSGGDGEETTPATTTEATTTAPTETEPEVTEPSDESSEETTPAEGESAGLVAAADAVFATEKWPAMMQVEDAEMLSSFFLIDESAFNEVYAAQCMMSAQTAELIIIDAAGGSLEDAVSTLEARRTKLIEQDAFYPASVEIAESSIVGSIGDYAYFIAWENPEEYVEILESALS